MASSSGPASATAGGGTSMVLNPNERTAFGYLFNLACPPDSGGILTADSAVAFFGKSGLPPTTLGAIWAMADFNNNGFLDAKGFSLACRLIGHAQAGAQVDFKAASTPGPVPTMEGITIPGISQQATAASTVTTDAAAVSIKPADRARYTRIFANAGPVNGLLDGDKARDLFVKSNMPFEKLAAIWGLADTQQRGALDLTDFIIAMHFIQNTMNGTLQNIPPTLPPGLYESASVGAPKPAAGATPASPSKPLRQQSTGGSFASPVTAGPIRHQATGSGPTPIPRQLTGQFVGSPAQGSRVGSPAPSAGSAFRPGAVAAVSSPFAAPAAASSQPTAASIIAAGAAVNPPWAVPAATIQRSATFFSQLDPSNTGSLSGASVVPFFMQSQLPEATLAQVWDLADVHQQGSLGLEEFSLAMHLMGECMAGKPIPGPGQSLPRELIPPNARGASLPGPVAQGESDTQKDLFSLMDDDDDTTSGALKAAAALPPALKNATASTFVNPAASPPPSALRSPPAAAPAQGSNFSNAFDDDFFNGPIPAAASPSATPVRGSAITKSVRIADRPPSIITSPDTVTSSLPSPGSQAQQQPTSLANVQAESLRKDIETETSRKSALSAEATALETSIATDSASLSELEARLKQARTGSDAEQARVVTLRERAATQSGELASLRAELISVESNLSALKVERDEVEQVLMKEREDVREIRKQMELVRKETEEVKAEVEKLKKEVRKEKGLGAITRKQLSTATSEKEVAEAELKEVQAEGSAAEAGEVGEPFGSATAPATVDRSAALSPTGSTRSNNPFDRLNVASPGPTAATGTPPVGDHTPAESSSTGALGLAAGAGAALAGIASAATAAVGLSGRSEDAPKEEEDQSKAADISTTATAEEPKQDVTATPETAAPALPRSMPHHARTTSFDDAFGEVDTAPIATDAPGQTGSNAAHDAFASAFDDDFGPPDAAPAGPAEAGNVGVTASSSTAFDDAFSGFDAVPSPSATRATATEPEAHAASERPADDEVTIRQAGGSIDDSNARPSQDDDEDDSSDEEHDGPEDLDAPGRKPRASPFEEAADESRISTDGTSGPTTGTTSLASSTSAPASAARELPAIVPPAVGSHFGTSLETPTSQLTAQITGSDTFHDARTATPVSEAQSPVALTASEPLDVEAGEPTPAAALSSAAAPKPARRAPPPAPTKATASTPSSTSAPLPATTSDNNKDVFDDFEAAFEDLGPAGTSASAEAGGAADTTATNTTTTDFDDAFDNDFDFVPSFSTSSVAATGGAAATGGGAAAAASGPASNAAKDAFDDAFGTGPSGSASASAGFPAPSGAGATTSSAPLNDFNAAFDDFDASFGGSPRNNNSAALSQSVASASGLGATGSGGSGTGTNVSAPSSGFSFEDAFEPAGDSVFGNPGSTVPVSPSPATATTVTPVPPSLPPRNSSSFGPSTGSTLTAPSTGGAGEEPLPSPALPDDAAPVQQLCQMGFPRGKVIAALEKSNYRVEKALQRLLAS
ncbi:hypothetical protein OC846_005300 [Tilletia horrida]|uniref:Uncharacterized protein n=1 Tax=Tilletia horrida TaxID=155126 RepID=A0AAN6JQD1_9BASI|nr:hypothetical protein OC845_005536 [Tilletia horrida]KAK0546367.1 hypothetical protein OC846_005300 [Tilletia horrida]KAK0562102.1 hypothetical protein OC861_005489 [Tilletia horrida]